MTHDLSRRGLLRAAGIGTVIAAGAAGTGGAARAAGDGSLRAVYHLTPSSGWLCDVQRPIVVDGETLVYHLHAAETAGPGGWDLATTRDGVTFEHHGPVLPIEGVEPVWSGSAVVDADGGAGYGDGAVIALATRLPEGEVGRQQQYLYWSVDGGRSFTREAEPVIPNVDAETAETPQELENAAWFRDPKVEWDPDRQEWVCVIGRQRYAAMYTSTDLHAWQLRRNFDYLVDPATDTDLGGIECPDLFRMRADDGTVHWVIGGSMDGHAAGEPMTFAYWVGDWDGELFTPASRTPQWLDHGYDWYSAVTWPDEQDPLGVRRAIAWMNNWKYAKREVPTSASDGYNGQASIVRELRLRREADGRYALVSTPLPAIAAGGGKAVVLPARDVTGVTPVPELAGTAYLLEIEMSWDEATNVGVSVGCSADGTRRVNIGVHGDYVYLDRGPADREECSFGEFRESRAPQDPAARSVRLQVFVDRQSVEVFVNEGHVVLSQQVYFREGDEGIALYADGGPARVATLRMTPL